MKVVFLTYSGILWEGPDSPSLQQLQRVARTTGCHAVLAQKPFDNALQLLMGLTGAYVGALVGVPVAGTTPKDPKGRPGVEILQWVASRCSSELEEYAVLAREGFDPCGIHPSKLFLTGPHGELSSEVADALIDHLNNPSTQQGADEPMNTLDDTDAPRKDPP